MDLKVCKICGRRYEACRPVYDGNIFRWQDVACCMEHGLEYFAKVAESRKKETAEQTADNGVNKDLESPVEKEKKDPVVSEPAVAGSKTETKKRRKKSAG